MGILPRFPALFDTFCTVPPGFAGPVKYDEISDVQMCTGCIFLFYGSEMYCIDQFREDLSASLRFIFFSRFAPRAFEVPYLKQVTLHQMEHPQVTAILTSLRTFFSMDYVQAGLFLTNEGYFEFWQNSPIGEVVAKLKGASVREVRLIVDQLNVNPYQPPFTEAEKFHTDAKHSDTQGQICQVANFGNKEKKKVRKTKLVRLFVQKTHTERLLNTDIMKPQKDEVLQSCV